MRLLLDEAAGRYDSFFNIWGNYPLVICTLV